MEEGRQISEDILRENCGEESLGNFNIVGRLQGKLAQIVLVEESIEKIRAKDDGGRNGDLNAIEMPANAVIVYQRVQKAQARALPPSEPPPILAKLVLGSKVSFSNSVISPRC